MYFCLVYFQTFSEFCERALDELNVLNKVTKKQFINTLKFFGEPPNTKAPDFFHIFTCFLENFEVDVHGVKLVFCCAFVFECILIVQLGLCWIYSCINRNIIIWITILHTFFTTECEKRNSNKGEQTGGWLTYVQTQLQTCKVNGWFYCIFSFQIHQQPTTSDPNDTCGV